MITSGLYTALVTPFSEGKVNEESLRKLVAHQRECGVKGLVALGTTAEVATLTDEEKKRVVSIIREEAKDMILLVGTGTNSTETTSLNTLKAADLGADGALVIVPYYNKPTQEGLYQHFAHVADISPIPILLYNIPGRVVTNLALPTFARLFSLKNIVGVKEVPTDFTNAIALLHQLKTVRPEALFLAGDDMLTLPLMAVGADGVISGSANLVPKEMLTLVNAALSGDLSTAKRWHRALMPLFQALSCETNPIPLKAALDIAGLQAGSPRLPMTEATFETKERLAEVISSLGIRAEQLR